MLLSETSALVEGALEVSPRLEGVRVPSTLTQSSPEANRDVVSTAPHLHGEQRPLTWGERRRRVEESFLILTTMPHLREATQASFGTYCSH